MQVRKGRHPRLTTSNVIVLCTFSLLLTLFFFYMNSKPNPNLLIQLACKATRYPETCQTSIKQSIPNPITILQIMEKAIWVSSENLKTAHSMLHSDPNCLHYLENSEYRINLTFDALSHIKITDARAWMSAALVYQYDCWSALKNNNNNNDEALSMMASLLVLSSNALSMMVSYDIYGDDLESWCPPKTERDGFWEDHGGKFTSGYSYEGGFPPGLKADVTVCKRGCEYGTVQEAVNTVPDEGLDRFVIRIKEGVYEETVRVLLRKRNVVFLGDGMGKTIITGSASVAHSGLSTYNTATLGVNGDGFMASGLTVENTAGPNAHQAVAFRSDSDLSVIENCEFIGNQDTLYAHSLRQFYKSCRIQGNVDFIFGNSASVFQDCLILVRPRQVKPQKGEKNAITAQGRTDPAQSTGFVFQNCIVNGTSEYMDLYYSKPRVHRNFLGRPWKEFSRTLFINCNLQSLISPLGWLPWTADFALKTLYYGEFQNSGQGANLSGRVPWSTLIPAQHVSAYSVDYFIQGYHWIPSSFRSTLT